MCLLAACCLSHAHALTLPPHSVRGLRPAAPAPLIVAASTPAAPVPSAQGIAVAWGVCGFLSILASAIKRLAPIALQPLLQRDLSWLQWGFYGGAMGIFAYVEGYGAFQKKFSPLVVERAMTLKQGASPMNVALAPFYSMGLMHATKKRKIVSWSVSLSVAMIVGVVKRLPCAPPPAAMPCLAHARPERARAYGPPFTSSHARPRASFAAQTRGDRSWTQACAQDWRGVAPQSLQST